MSSTNVSKKRFLTFFFLTLTILMLVSMVSVFCIFVYFPQEQSESAPPKKPTQKKMIAEKKPLICAVKFFENFCVSEAELKIIQKRKVAFFCKYGILVWTQEKLLGFVCKKDFLKDKEFWRDKAKRKVAFYGKKAFYYTRVNCEEVALVIKLTEFEVEGGSIRIYSKGPDKFFKLK